MPAAMKPKKKKKKETEEEINIVAGSIVEWVSEGAATSAVWK